MEKLKVCKKCRESKPLSEFHKQKSSPDGHKYECKPCRNGEWTRSNGKYRGVYKEQKRLWNLTAAGIYNALGTKGRAERIITKDEFISWYNKQPKICVYCGIKEEEVRLVKDSFNHKTRRLSIDRIDCDRPYEKGNVALSCLRCNYIKSDFFSFCEMKVIGRMVSEKWKKKLNNA